MAIGRILFRGMCGLAAICLLTQCQTSSSNKHIERDRVLAEAQAASDKMDYAMAVELLLPLAEQGDAEAQFMMSRLPRRPGMDLQFDGYLYWQTKAAQGGHATAAFFMGQLYIMGVGVPENGEHGAAWLRYAAQLGSWDAKYLMGGLYEMGQAVPQNYVHAYKWFLAAELDGEDTTADWVEWATQGVERNRAEITQAEFLQAQALAKICRDTRYTQCD